MYCELGSPEKASAIITPEIETQRAHGTQGKAFRHLLLLAIDTDIRRGLYLNTEKTLQEVDASFSRLSVLDTTD